MLESINLSLSSSCDANCIYCPSDRGRRIKQKFMSFKYAKQIIDEISGEAFQKIHRVHKIEIGENGEAFLNKDTIRILRYIRLNLPKIKINVCTNFRNLDENKSKRIISEHLIDSIACNIDGVNKENYFLVKRLDLKIVRKNLLNFLKLRKKLNSKISMHLYFRTLHDYIWKIKKNFGFYPAKLNNIDVEKISDDSQRIIGQFKKRLYLKRDKLCRGKVVGWAERSRINTDLINYQNYSCPNLHRIEKEMFIAPDGTCYACCLDSNNELVFGNVITESVNSIFFGEKRKKLIKLLKNKQFKIIGGPCKTVNCCQWLK